MALNRQGRAVKQARSTRYNSLRVSLRSSYFAMTWIILLWFWSSVAKAMADVPYFVLDISGFSD